MARTLYAADPASFTVAASGRIVPGTTLSVKDADGDAVTDLLAAVWDNDTFTWTQGAAITSVTSDDDGLIAFFGPDNFDGPLYLSGGTSAALLVRPHIVGVSLGAGVVGTSQLATGAVTSGKLAAGAVTSGKIAASAVGTTEIADDAVTAAKIAADAVGASEIAAGAVGTSELADGSVTSAKIAVGAVVEADIADGAVTNAKVATNAAIAQSKIDQGVQTFSNANATIDPGTRVLIQTGTLTAPRTVTLPAANAVPAGTEITVMDVSGSVGATNTLTIQRAGSDALNAGSSESITMGYSWRRFRSNGSNLWSFDAGIVRSGRNLADLASASAARTNLGLGTAATSASGDFAPAATALGAGIRPLANAYASIAAAAVSAISLGAGECRTAPLLLFSGTLDRIGVAVTTAAGAGGGGVVRLGIYSDDGTGRPGTLILDAGTVDATTTGVKEITISQAVTRGVYWLVAVPQVDGCALRTVSSSAMQVTTTTAPDTAITAPALRLAITGALPATASAPTAVTAQPVRAFVRYSAVS